MQWHRGKAWRIAGISFLVLLTLLVVGVLFFPWDMLREPVNRYVSQKTGREFAITQRLDVHLGRDTTVTLDGVRFANPDWAEDAQLIQAEKVEFDISLWPLLRGRIELPKLHLTQPQVSLQQQADGRRSWALGEDTSDESNLPRIGEVKVDRGQVRYLAEAQGADIVAALNLDYAQPELPLQYEAKGKWKNQAFTAQGRAGDVMRLNEVGATMRFPLKVDARAGRTTFKADGTVSSLASLDGIDAAFEIRGADLADLYTLVGVVLPNTPNYSLNGQLNVRGERWQVAGLRGRLGSSDLSGELTYDQGPAVPMLSGKVQSRVLDMDDLGPLIGLSPSQAAAVKKAVAEGDGKPAAAAPATAAAKAAPSAPAAVAVAPARTRVLPTAPLDTTRLAAMNADVTYTAASIRHVDAVPLERGSVRVQLNDSVLQLDPLVLGVAGGRVQGAVRIEGKTQPAQVHAALGVRGLQLDQLFPTVERMRASFGRLNGNLDLRGPGNSVAQWLGASSGHVRLAMGQGRFSNLILEVVGLDGGEIVKFFLQGDRNVELRCAAASFNVQRGLMSSESLVLDTSDTVVTGDGRVNLTDETLNFTLRPSPKDMSILSLRSPLHIRGTFTDPAVALDKPALAGRGALALALGAINPLLALAATIETGPGEDTDCAAVLNDARSAANARRPAGSANARAPSTTQVR